MDKLGNTPLLNSAENGHKETVQLLIEKGVDVNANNHEGQSALHFAVISGHDEVVRVLIENGANPNNKNNHDESPFLEAVRHKKKHIVSLFFEYMTLNEIDEIRGILIADNLLHLADEADQSMSDTLSEFSDKFKETLAEQGENEYLANLVAEFSVASTSLTIAKLKKLLSSL